MPAKQSPFFHRILLRLLLPVVGVGILVTILLVAHMSAPMKAFLTHQFDANLRLAATMGLRTCEDSLDYLLELRLEQSAEMNRVLQSEALEKIKAFSDDFPHIHILVVRSGRAIVACHAGDSPETWEGPALGSQSDTPFVSQMGGTTARFYTQFFPFWDWHIVSFVTIEAFQSPLRMAHRATYLSTVGVFVALVITLLIVFQLFIKKPLDRLATATRGVAGGRLVKIDKVARSEFGQLMVSFNEMVASLEAEKAEVRHLIHQLKSIYNTLPVIVWSLDKEAIFTLSEGKELETLGLQPGQVVGGSAFELYKDVPEILANIKKALQGQPCEYESEVQGNIYHTVINPVLDDDGEVQWISGLAVNVSERKRVENEVRQLRNYLSNIIDSMPSVLIGVDTQGVVTQWNREARRVTGVDAEAAKGHPLKRVFPHLAGELKHIQDAIATREVRSEPRRARQKGGQPHYEDVTIYPLVANGVEGAVIRVDDVTEQVRLEEMMIQSEKMLSVGGLAAGMAHEINNPLAGILQNTAVVTNRLSGQLPANHEAAEAAGTSMDAIEAYCRRRKLPTMLENIRTSGAMAAAIVKNMLSFARKSEGVAASHDLGELLDQSIDLLSTDYDMKRHYDFKHIRIVREYAPEVGPVPCEASKLQQVFMNILKNGAEAMAEAEPPPHPPGFILRVLDDGPQVRVEIEDQGPGMDEKTRRRIFEPFFTTKPTGEGTGLGLSVSYFIVVDDHSGEMGVLPADGGGTRFVIRLPKARKTGQ